MCQGGIVWEYLVIEVDGAGKCDGGLTNLNELGRQGWELVTIQMIRGDMMAFLKRLTPFAGR